jgi:antitoxin ParD1/3/4
MRQVKTMNVSLSPELHTFVTERVASGRFASASEVVRAGLRLLQETERQQAGPARPDKAEHPPNGR